ncbi:hypothetical protein H5232_11650 [Pseudoalteromonas sp. SG41-5]|uniref:hypothetical protein n=1 Tax=Pseudoalteromonas sp. SG41-5 TaxID=2760975 RepID=UPI001604A017|nr:hypothetical protein [Pseudoalteromonas sp. SG41-5]MBB1469098.1 hypothetical protein [Pseudoalteromonas sp. SG41-5]
MDQTNKKTNSAKNALKMAVLSVVLSVVIFYCRFDIEFNAPMKNWVETATYFNNLLSPIFLLITIFLLYWTWKDTKEGFNQQNADNVYNYIIDSTTKFADSYKQELERDKYEESISMNNYMYLISCAYTSYLKDGEINPIGLREKLPEVYQSYIDNSSVIVTSSTFFYKQYSQLTNEQHQISFKLHLFGILGRDILTSMVFSKLRVKHNLEEKGFGYKHTIAEIEFLKSVTLIAHNDANNKLIDSYFDDQKLDSFYMILNPK